MSTLASHPLTTHTLLWVRWGAGMPNNAAGAENCVQVFGAGSQEGRLGDVDCNAKRPYYCAKSL